MYKQVFLEKFYPSIMINIWCYPTSRVFSTSCVQYCGEWFWCLLLLFLKHICRSSIGIQHLESMLFPWAKKGRKFGYFLHNCFKKKGGGALKAHI
jgi:hypothetical protein